MNTQNKINGATKPRVSKTDWLNAALDVLRESGIEAVRVERLADKLNVSKSGFYYHFNGRADLSAALLEHWKQLDAVPMSQMRNWGGASPVDVLQKVVETVSLYDLSGLDMAIRNWAATDPDVKKVYRKEAKQRVAHIRRIFESMGFVGDDLEMRVHTFVGYTTTERLVFSDMKPRERARLWKLRMELLTQP